MELFRFLGILFPSLFIISCHEGKRNTNTHIQMSDLSPWNTQEYSLSSRKIRHEIDRLRLLPAAMYADSYTHKYYADGSPFLWITRSGVSAKADSLLAYLQQAASAGLEENIFHTQEILDDLQRIRHLDFDARNDINTVYGRTEFRLTRAYLRYVCGQRFGYVRPDLVFNRLEQTDTAQNAPFGQSIIPPSGPALSANDGSGYPPQSHGQPGTKPLEKHLHFGRKVCLGEPGLCNTLRHG